MSGIVFQHILFLSRSHHYHLRLSRNSGNNKNLRFLDSQVELAVSCTKVPCNRFLPHPQVASSSSSGEWLDSKIQQKKKRIAGIDQDELLDPIHLADPDSCFCEFKGVHIHYKVYNPESQTHALSELPHSAFLNIGLPIILLHGFGASAFSWSRCMKRLAEVTSSKVLAFDRPAFGLTSRVPNDTNKPLNPYSMAFSVLASLYFIDFLTADMAVLVGHSAGSLVAVNAYFEAPERVAALILIAPAILAPSAVRNIVAGNKEARDTQTEGNRSNSNMFKEQFIKLFKISSNFAAYIARAIVQLLKGMSGLLKSLYTKALSTIFCSTFGVMLIRMLIDKFGIAAVRTAWYDANKVTEHVIDGYTKPLRAKGWDKALAEFTAATLASSESESKPPLSKRLHEISCPVLIITGDNDRIVPSWNAKKLSQAIPGSCLEVIKHCGHLPHEEKVEEFVSAVTMFLRRAFGDSKEPSLQVVT